MTIVIDVTTEAVGWEQTPAAEATVRKVIEAALADGEPGDCEIGVVLSDDARICTLNRTWRGKDAATNVLSFPADDDIGEPGLLGDVVLAYETTRKEAREQDIALQDHVSHLVIHGVLHLLGLDHAEDAEAERMENLERAALASLGIADPYADEERARPAEMSS